MSTNNSYAVESLSPSGGPEQGLPTEAMNRSMQALVETRPWVRLMGVFAAIGTIICGLRCLFAAPTLLSRLVEMASGAPSGFDGLQTLKHWCISKLAQIV